VTGLLLRIAHSQSNTYKTIAGAEYNIHVRKGADKGQVETSTGNQVKSFKKEDVRKVMALSSFVITSILSVYTFPIS